MGEVRLVEWGEPLNATAITFVVVSCIVFGTRPCIECSLVQCVMARPAIAISGLTIHIACRVHTKPSRSHKQIELTVADVATRIDDLNHKIAFGGDGRVVGLIEPLALFQTDVETFATIIVRVGTGRGIPKFGGKSVHLTRQDHVLTEHHHVRTGESVHPRGRNVPTATRIGDEGSVVCAWQWLEEVMIRLIPSKERCGRAHPCEQRRQRKHCTEDP